MISIEQIDSLLENDGAVIDSNGDKVGKVEQVFVGDSSHEPQWVTAKTGLFGHSETFIPLEKATIDGSNVRVPYDKATIKDAPRTDSSDGHLEPEEEAELYRYYGLQRSSADRVDSAGGTDSDAGVRLRKHTVRENVTVTVPVEREEVRVVEDPARGDNKSEGFGHNEYDQLTGPQSEDLEHPRGTRVEDNADQHADGRRSRDARAAESPYQNPGDQPKSEGFGHNEYDQLTGPQSEDLQHPRGTGEEERDTLADNSEAVRDAGVRDGDGAHKPGSHGRHAR